VSESDASHLFGRLRESQGKYAYFLLAVAASAIALVVKQTADKGFQSNQIPLAAAVLCYGASFVCGCLQIEWGLDRLRTDAAVQAFDEGTYTGKLGLKRAMNTEVLREVAAAQTRRGDGFSRWQFRLLISGAVFYLAWHVLTMWARTTA